MVHVLSGYWSTNLRFMCKSSAVSVIWLSRLGGVLSVHAHAKDQ